MIRRWRESGADSRQLWREIQAQGYRHSARTVGRFITRLAWSNGVTAGQIHRLTLVKRQGYGRAGFALLRQRVLQAA